MNHRKSAKKNSGPDDAGQSVREFISGAAHDLREPLRAIRAHAQLLATLSEHSQDDRREQCIGHIHTGVDRMEALIRDLEEYYAEEIRELDPRMTSMELVLFEAQRRLSSRLGECEAVLTHESLPAVTGDFEALAGVFCALIDNACKFRSAAAPRIHVSAVCEGSSWVFSVADNGQGFDQSYADLIFKPFERLNGRRYPGSGLGLPIARRIVERHRGKIWAESQANLGSTFRFVLS